MPRIISSYKYFFQSDGEQNHIYLDTRTIISCTSIRVRPTSIRDGVKEKNKCVY